MFQSTLFSLQMQQNANSGREEGRESLPRSLNRVQLRCRLMTHILSGPREGKTQIYENTEERLFVVPGVKNAPDKAFKQQQKNPIICALPPIMAVNKHLKQAGSQADYPASGSFSYSRRKRFGEQIKI